MRVAVARGIATHPVDADLANLTATVQVPQCPAQLVLENGRVKAVLQRQRW